MFVYYISGTYYPDPIDVKLTFRFWNFASASLSPLFLSGWCCRASTLYSVWICSTCAKMIWTVLNYWVGRCMASVCLYLCLFVCAMARITAFDGRGGCALNIRTVGAASRKLSSTTQPPHILKNDWKRRFALHWSRRDVAHMFALSAPETSIFGRRLLVCAIRHSGWFGTETILYNNITSGGDVVGWGCIMTPRSSSPHIFTLERETIGQNGGVLSHIRIR